MHPVSRRWNSTTLKLTLSRSISVFAFFTLFITFAQSVSARHFSSHPRHHLFQSPRKPIKSRQSQNTPLIVTNQCEDTIYPGIISQSDGGPGTGGFELSSGNSKTLTVAENWQGRVWGRTNCSFNSDGTGSSSGNGPACMTGDCGSIVSCEGAGQTPVSLAEFTLDTGSGQTFYDLSLVDGYNIPIAILMHPDQNSSFAAIPPSLTNPSCVASIGDLAPSGFDPYSNGDFLGTNSSDPLPFDKLVTSSQVAKWCPSELEVDPLTSPAGGVYVYPDGNLDRPIFDPCFSACAKYDEPQYCCTGSYDSPSSCSPSPYSKAAKAVCPDAYSYAFDDQTSTFIIPAGAGFEVIFCPGGRSTNILATSKSQLTQLAQSGSVQLKPREVGHDNYPSLRDVESVKPSVNDWMYTKLSEAKESEDLVGKDQEERHTNIEEFNNVRIPSLNLQVLEGSPYLIGERSLTDFTSSSSTNVSRRQGYNKILMIEIGETRMNSQTGAAGRISHMSWFFRVFTIVLWVWLFA